MTERHERTDLQVAFDVAAQFQAMQAQMARENKRLSSTFLIDVNKIREIFPKKAIQNSSKLSR